MLISFTMEITDKNETIRSNDYLSTNECIDKLACGGAKMAKIHRVSNRGVLLFYFVNFNTVNW